MILNIDQAARTDKKEPIESLVQIGGVVRFSLLCIGGFKKRKHDEQAITDQLYSDERIDIRFKLFENCCIHTFQHQTNPNFKLAVAVGDSMPKKYMDRLHDIVAGLPQAQIIKFPVIPHRDAVSLAFNQIFDDSTPYKFGFRIDDDDAVAVNYIESLFGYAPHMIAVSQGRFPMALTFPKGLTVFGMGPTKVVVPAGITSPPSAGLAMLSKLDWEGNIYDFRHKRITTTHVALADPSDFMYMRVIHGHNVSRHPVPKFHLELSGDEIDMIMRRQFSLSLSEFLTI